MRACLRARVRACARACVRAAGIVMLNVVVAALLDEFIAAVQARPFTTIQQHSLAQYNARYQICARCRTNLLGVRPNARSLTIQQHSLAQYNARYQIFARCRTNLLGGRPNTHTHTRGVRPNARSAGRSVPLRPRTPAPPSAYPALNRAHPPPPRATAVMPTC